MMNDKPACYEITPVLTLVEHLKAIPEESFGIESVDRVLTRVDLELESLVPFTHTREGAYTRNLIYRDSLFEVLLLCWAPGQETPVHNHRGQLGWMVVTQGKLTVVNYKRLRCSHECHKAERFSEMVADRILTASEGFLCHVREGETVHQIRNEGPEPATSLHIYSRPIDSCVIYDVVNKTCRDKTLKNFTVFGERCVEC